MKKTKRILSFLLCLLILPACMLPLVSASDTGSCGPNLKWGYNDTESLLVISGSGAMYDYELFQQPWEKYSYGIKAVHINEGVTKIGNNAFYLMGIESIINGLPDSLELIGQYAFASTDITRIRIPMQVKSIGTHAFDHCISLSSVEFAEGVLAIENDAFLNCTKLKEISFPSSLKRIGSSAFGNCSSLEKVTFSDGITEIPVGTFENCTALTELDFPLEITSVRESSFQGCTGLKKITFRNPYCEIDTASLHPLTNEDLVICGYEGSTAEMYAVTRGYRFESLGKASGEDNGTCGQNAVWLFDKGTRALYIKGSGEIQDYSDSVHAPWYHLKDEIQRVHLDRGITTIGMQAFKGCGALECVELPDTLYRISNSAFYGCARLRMIDIPASVKEIYPYAFAYCTSLQAFSLPQKLEGGHIGFLFEGCTQLKAVYIASDMQPFYTYSGCPNLTLYGKAGSKAQLYAAENGIEFVTVVTGKHYPVEIKKKEASWTEAGLRCTICIVCGLQMSEEEIPSLINQCDGGAACPSGKFVDVNPKEWYHPYVDYAVTHGLFGGTSANTFEPESAMTRAMLVTVLWRYEGKPMRHQNTFSDVNAKSGSWYIDAVAWAAANGIVGGVGNNKFDPDGNITREQMATILFRYAQKKGIDTSKRGNLNAFPDGGKTASWAKDAMQWTVGEGIINGSDGKLLPQGSATRAQVATILMRYIENIVKR